MDITTEGIVIRETLQGENDKLLTILTPQHGKVTAFAKGVKKISSKNAPACQLFVFSEYELIEKFGRLTVKTAVSKELFYGMRSDMTRYSLACYFAEVLNRTCVENDNETEALRLFLNCLYALSNKKEIKLSLIKSAFELKLMCINGFMPDFDNCISCSRNADYKSSTLFSFEESGILCSSCLEKFNKSSFPYSCTISEQVVDAMKYICMSQQAKMLIYNISDSDIKELSFICENYLIHKTEKTYETLKIYKSILNSLGEK